jgi:hypothetical protein
MGLDQYCYAVSKSLESGDFTFPDDADREEFMYWRKHNALHGWMQNLYSAKGGKDTFNCVPLRLTKEDLQHFISDIQSQKVKETSGFFFGSQNYYDNEEMNADIEFAYKAMAKIDQGNDVYYYSWW